MESVNFKI